MFCSFIDGSYTPLQFNPIVIDPHCSGGSDGQIIGNITLVLVVGLISGN